MFSLDVNILYYYCMGFDVCEIVKLFLINVISVVLGECSNKYLIDFDISSDGKILVYIVDYIM